VNPQTAKEILVRYRPGTADERDPEIAEAIAFCQQDPELQHWLHSHCEYQRAIREKLRSSPVPADLRERLLSSRKVVRVPVWRRPAAWLAAAAIIVFLGVALIWQPGKSPDRFAGYEARVVGSAVREYHMEVVTNDMAALRQHIAHGGAPGDYDIPDPLRQLELTGGGVLTWRNNPVGMVCFDRGDRQMLFLFVARASAFRDPPGPKPQVTRLADLISVSWRAGDKCYTLAGPADSAALKSYL
jgi:uncharacterized membrane protein YbaN (DUF454 family)